MLIQTVPVIGPIEPPVNKPVKTPAEAAQGFNTRMMEFTSPVVLTVDWGNKISYPKGVHPVPEHLADHWFLKAHGVKPYSSPVAVSASAEKAAKSK